MEKSATFDPESTVFKKEKYSDTEDSEDEDLTTLNKINYYSKYYSHHPTTLEEPIKVDPTVMSANAIKLIRTIEKSLSADKTACSSDGKAQIKVEKNNMYDENESQHNSPESGENTIIDPFAGSTIPSVPKYIFGPKPPRNPGLFDCLKCGINFGSLAVLNRHNIHQHVKKSYNPQRPIVCDICDKSFKLFPDLVNHRKCRHRILNPLYQSTTCSMNEGVGNENVKKVFSDSDEWVPDSTIGDGNHGYGGNEKSDVPPKYIFGPKPPENEGLFSCRKCSKNLASREHLDRHNLSTHMNKIPNPSKPHVCNVCDKVFKSIRKMMYHKIHLHKIYNPQYKIYKEQLEKNEIVKSDPSNSSVSVTENVC